MPEARLGPCGTRHFPHVICWRAVRACGDVLRGNVLRGWRAGQVVSQNWETVVRGVRGEWGRAG